MSTVLHTESSAGLGGQEIRTLDEAGWSRERGWRVILAGQPGGQLLAHARARGLEAVPLRMRGPWDVSAMAALAALIRREGVDIVHTHSSIDAWVGGLAARVARVPVVRTRHVSIPIRHGWNPVYTQLADRVLTSAEAIRSLIVAAGASPERVVALPAGVRLADFPFGARSPELARALGLGTPVVGSVAMFRGSKGHRELIEAFRLVRAACPGASLLLVGDGIRRPWVESLAREAGLAHAVVFTGFRADVPALLGTMDCFVLASTRTEGIPQSLLQAFAAGVPVVASEVGGIPEVLTDGVTGVLVKAGAPEAFAQGIERAVTDPDGAIARARRARTLVETRFSHETVTDRLLGLYEQVLAAQRGAGGRT